MCRINHTLKLNKDHSKALCVAIVRHGMIMKYFTEKEVQQFKEGSINYPYIVVEKEQHEVIEVSEIVRISGMADNNGTPNEIGIQVHTKGEPTKHLTYRLVE